MGSRRMFSQRIVSSARFLKMPISSQTLYFHLGMNADDDGVVEAFTVMRMVGCSEDDLRILEAKGFVKVFNEDLVTYIIDWNENNKIRSDRIIYSKYRDLLVSEIPDVELIEKRDRADVKSNIVVDVHVTDNGQTIDGQWSDNGQSMDSPRTDNGQTMDSLSKDKISKDNLIQINSREDKSGEGRSTPEPPDLTDKECRAIVEYYNYYCKELPRVTFMNDELFDSIRDCSKAVGGCDRIMRALDMTSRSLFLNGSNSRNWKASFAWIIQPKNTQKILDGKYANRDSPEEFRQSDDVEKWEDMARAWANS